MVDFVRQQGITAGRDFAGGDINQTTNNLYVGRVSAMQALIRMYHAEKQENVEFCEVLADLQHYLVAPGGGEPIGLEAKFTLAGLEADFLDAAQRKEMFAMKLKRNQLSRAAQEIFSLIMGRAVLLFRTYVKPIIDARFDRAVVHQTLVERVIDPIMEELEDNVLLLKYPDLEGMVYFLTGNCHLRWHVG
jgi:hypothetical protein